MKRDPTFGVPIRTQEEAESAAFFVCGWDSVFPDDQWGTCSRCHRPICFRPHAPKKPPKVCLDCAPRMIREQGITGGAMTEATARELAEARRRMSH